jgi:hypothetical protein
LRWNRFEERNASDAFAVVAELGVEDRLKMKSVARTERIRERRFVRERGYEIVYSTAGRLPSEKELIRLAPGGVGWLAVRLETLLDAENVQVRAELG